jgi:hypothetical protein
MPSPHTSPVGMQGVQPGIASCAHTPPRQASVVHALPSLHSVSRLQATQPGMTVREQLPSTPH